MNSIENLKFTLERGSKISKKLKLEKDNIYCSIIVKPKHGYAKISKDGKWTYCPNKTFVGKDEIHIKKTYKNKDPEYIIIKVNIEDKNDSTNIDNIIKVVEHEDLLRLGNKSNDVFTIIGVYVDIKLVNKKIVSNRFNEKRLIMSFEVVYSIDICYDSEEDDKNDKNDKNEMKEKKNKKIINNDYWFINKESKIVVRKKRFNAYINLPKFIDTSKELTINKKILDKIYKIINTDLVKHYLVLELDVDGVKIKKS